MDHPIRTLIYELFLEPVAQQLERMWGFVYRSYERNPTMNTPALLTEPTGPITLPSRRPRPKP
jgi:hypothetical protein